MVKIWILIKVFSCSNLQDLHLNFKKKKKILYGISIILNLQEDDEFIGFATLPDQVHRKAVKRGFEFSFMVVG